MKTLLNVAFGMFILCLTSNVITAQTASLTSNIDIAESDSETTSEKDELIKKYPWVKTHMKNNTTDLLKVSEVLSEGIHNFVMIETDDNKTFYDKDGNRYCTQTDEVNCEEFYNMSPGQLKWNRS